MTLQQQLEMETARRDARKREYEAAHREFMALIDELAQTTPEEKRLKALIERRTAAEKALAEMTVRAEKAEGILADHAARRSTGLTAEDIITAQKAELAQLRSERAAMTAKIEAIRHALAFNPAGAYVAAGLDK